MLIVLNKPFAANASVDPWDVRQIKKVLNRLGYYQPLEKTGITDIPDRVVFEALKQFQKDHGLPPTGEAKPDDETVKRLSQEADKIPSGYYTWRTVADGKVRQAHAQYESTVRAWDDSPDPGQDFNCRCWAEPVKDIVVPQNESQDVKDAFEKVKGDLKDFDKEKKYLSGRLLRHYMNKSGTLIVLPSIAMDGSSTVQSAIAINQQRFLDSLIKGRVGWKSTPWRDKLLLLKDREKVDLEDYWDIDRNKTRLYLEGDNDFVHAIGSVKITSEAVIRARREGNKIILNGQVTHRFNDTYDFIGGLDNPVNELFKEELLLEKTGYAKIFKTYWEKSQKLKGKIIIGNDGAIEKSTFKWLDGDR